MKRRYKISALLYAFIALLSTGCAKTENLQDMIDYLAVQLEENGNWCFVDPDGKLKYEDEFKDMPSCVINGFFSVKEGEGYTLYKADSKPVAVKNCEGLKAVGYFNEGLVPIVREKSRIILVDGNGKDVFTLQPVKGKEILSCESLFNDGLLIFKTEDEKVGAVNTKGEISINPTYDHISRFTDGFSLAIKDEKYVLINKEGEEVLKLKKDWTPLTASGARGVFVVKNANDNVLFVDKKGETEKCPITVKTVTWFNNEYYIFETGGLYGVMKRGSNESVIRAKYKSIWFMDNGNFLCIDSKHSCIVDAKGEIIEKLEEYDDIVPIAKFGLIAKDNKYWMLLDENGKQKKGCEFYQFNFNGLATFYGLETDVLYSDYFNVESMARNIAEHMSTTGFENVKLGVGPSNVLSDPDDYIYTSTAQISSLSGGGVRYEYKVFADFDGIITSSVNIDPYGFQRYYYWNTVKLNCVTISINAESSLGEYAVKAMEKEFVKKGFSVAASKYINNGGVVLMTTKESTLFIISNSDSKDLEIYLTNPLDEEALIIFKEQVKSFDGGSTSKDDEIGEITDTLIGEEIIDTIAVEVV